MNKTIILVVLAFAAMWLSFFIPETLMDATDHVVFHWWGPPYVFTSYATVMGLLFAAVFTYITRAS